MTIKEKAILQLYNCKKLKNEIKRVTYRSSSFHYGSYENDLFQDLMEIFILMDDELINDLYTKQTLNQFANKTLYFMVSKTGMAYYKYIRESRLGEVYAESSSNFTMKEFSHSNEDEVAISRLEDKIEDNIDMEEIQREILWIFKTSGIFKLQDEMFYHWYYIDKMTYQDIEKMTGISDSTIRYQLIKIISKVKNQLIEREIIF